VPNDYNDFQLAGNEEHKLGHWWVCPPKHLNYFSATSLRSLLERCGYTVRKCVASFPLEMFLLFGDVYVGDQELGKKCHLARVRFETALRKCGKIDKLRRFYEALASLDIGRQVVAFAVPRK